MATATIFAEIGKSMGTRDVPHISLPEAVEKARVLLNKARRNPVRVSTAATYLGYSPKASSAGLTIAALKKFGFIIDEGTSEGRQVKLSDLGYQILADQRDESPDRIDRLRQCALLPKGHRMLWEEFGSDLPDDKTVLSFLMLERGYADAPAKQLLRVYRASITYAGLDRQDRVKDVGNSDVDNPIGDRDAGEGPMNNHSASSRSGFPPTNGEANSRILSVPLDDAGSKSIDVRFPVGLTKEDMAYFIEHLKLWERRIVSKVTSTSEDD